MNQEKPLLKYFFEGFALANRNLEIYFLGLIIVILPPLLSAILPNLPILNALSPVFYLISFGFSLSIPKFLIQKHHNYSLSLKNIFSTTMQSTKRIILPSILLFIIATILLMVIFALVVIFLRPTPEQIAQFFRDFNYSNIRWHPFFLILVPVISFFVFTPILFSLEHKGLITSLLNSISTSFSHLPYLSIVIAIDFISYAGTSFFPIYEVWGSSAEYIISSYIGLVVISSTLLYYQKKIRNESFTPQTRA